MFYFFIQVFVSLGLILTTFYIFNKKEITNLEVENNSFTDSLKNLSVKEKIKALIDQNRYIFNTKVILIFPDYEKACQIAGVLNNHIITMDNEIIKIDDLQDIKILK